MATLAGLQVSENIAGSLFKSKTIIHTTISDSGIDRNSDNWIPSLLYRKHWSQIRLKSMLSMDIFTTEGIHFYCNQEIIFKIPILTNVRAGPSMSGPDLVCPGRA